MARDRWLVLPGGRIKRFRKTIDCYCCGFRCKFSNARGDKQYYNRKNRVVARKILKDNTWDDQFFPLKARDFGGRITH